MLLAIKELLSISEKRVSHQYKKDNSNWEAKYKDYLVDMRRNMKEAEIEIKKGDNDSIESELGDIFWDYICLLNTLEKDKGISIDDVFRKCKRKFNSRLKNDLDNDSWYELKRLEKKGNKKSLNELVGNMFKK